MTEQNKDESVRKSRDTVKARTVMRSSYRRMGDSKTDGTSVATDNRHRYDKKSHANSSKDFQSVREAIEKKINDFFEANKESGLRKLVSASKLMEAGVHIGMPAKFWNPKMKPFIYPKKGNRAQVIDILKTMVFMDRAYNFLRDVAREGGTVLLVGTRGEIIKEHVKNEAKRVKCFYINQRWLGGTLTNFKTINNSISKLNKFIALQISDEIKKYSKKEQVMIAKETEKMGKFLGGIRTMRYLPQALVITDPIHEHNALMEARKLNIPVIAFANTNANPDLVDFLIPANSSSIKTVWLLISIMCDAIAEAAGEPLAVVGKKDEEIVLPEIVKKEPDQGFIQHKRFTRGNFTRPGFEKRPVKTETIKE
ncbi:MAG: 30S ribosomal protein S2 [Mycoplasmataceae bacterium]|nr:30S ribosomal protein S2 [Mycoplasmataceae bacterium]